MLPDFGMSSTKFNIFKNATELFCWKGFHAVSINNIATECGLAPGSLYNYFSAKEEILEKAFDYYDYYFPKQLPDLDALAARIGIDHPKDILMFASRQYEDREMNIFLNKIFIMMSKEMFNFPKALEIFKRNIFELPRSYLGSLLEKMTADGIIEPIDIDKYMYVYSNMCHSSILLSLVDCDNNLKRWMDIQEFIIDHMIKLKRDS